MEARTDAYGRLRGHQRWRSLLFLHWAVDPGRVAPLLPAGLEVDTFGDLAWIGIVAFTMEGVRPAFLPEPFGLAFPETNVRTYVRRRGEDPGVYFFSLDAGSPLAVAGARLGWGLPYHPARITVGRDGDTVDYRLERRGGAARLHVRYTPGAGLGVARRGTLEYFLIERYVLHVLRRGRLRRGRVVHDPYPLQRARLHTLEESLLFAAGLPAPGHPPLHAHYAAGVDVLVYEG